MNIRRVIIILLVGYLIVSGIVSYSDKKNKTSETKKTVLKKEDMVKAGNLKAAVAAHLDLPTDEEPTIANISDVNKVKNEVFFKNAKNGDKVLIYSKAQKAILYRPSEDKIIEVASLNLQIGESVSAQAPEATAEAGPPLTPTQ